MNLQKAGGRGRFLVGACEAGRHRGHRNTDGNPFFVTEVLAAGSETIPATVRDAVTVRAARLTVAARRALDTAAWRSMRSAARTRWRW